MLGCRRAMPKEVLCTTRRLVGLLAAKAYLKKVFFRLRKRVRVGSRLLWGRHLLLLLLLPPLVAAGHDQNTCGSVVSRTLLALPAT